MSTKYLGEGVAEWTTVVNNGRYYGDQAVVF